MPYTPHCPKCGSRAGFRVERDQYSSAGSRDDSILRCRCGFFLYGRGAIQSLIALQQAAFLKSAEASREEAKTKKAANTIPTLSVAKRAKQSSEESISICAWVFCTKGSGGVPASKRENSKYCSRDCSNRNARHRWKKKNNNEAA